MTLAELQEFQRLRNRVVLQRRELRRLNKVLGPYWKGFVTGLWAERETVLRGKMIDAFGHEAVRKAEGK